MDTCKPQAGGGVFSNRCQTGERLSGRFRISAFFVSTNSWSRGDCSRPIGFRNTVAGDLSLLQASSVKPPPREKYSGLKGWEMSGLPHPRGSDQARFIVWRFDMYLRYSGLPFATILTTFYAKLDSYSDIRTSYSYLDVIIIHLFLFVACVRFVVRILLLDNISFV
jgi:Na+(H+)/acetate symporter ActP